MGTLLTDLIMLPDNINSTIPIADIMLSPDNRRTTVLSDWEMGGVALNDASQGLMVRNWRCWMEGGGYVRLQAENDETIHDLFQESGIRELSFCFDQNMRWAVAYSLEDETKLRWYDSLVAAYVVSTFPLVSSPKLGMDDKRPMHMDTNDMIFAYISDSKLCYRQQRDRFMNERVLRENLFPGSAIRNIGMNDHLRFQIELA